MTSLTPTFPATALDVLLSRRGLLFVDGPPGEGSAEHARAVALELSHLGYLPTARLQRRLAQVPVAQLTELNRWAGAVLSAGKGSKFKHVPLFRAFPKGIPKDTTQLWWAKVLCHFLQAPESACLFCRETETTHVLDPCLHVVCDRCFDGASYSACPVCERHVAAESPFFQAPPERTCQLPQERVRFELIDLGADLDAEARLLLRALCARTQALSPDDRDALTALLRDCSDRALGWLPDSIPVRETVALVFGTLCRERGPDAVLPLARSSWKTSTDVLRFVAAYSGADPALLETSRPHPLSPEAPRGRWAGAIAEAVRELVNGATPKPQIEIRTPRFKVAPLPRRLRRALLAALDGLAPASLAEDMLRHRSLWVRVGEFLHPHEYATRFPNTARAFQIVRKRAPDGTPGPAFQTYNAKLEAAAQAGDAATFTDLLLSRPGELARRYDHALRLAGDDDAARRRLVEAFCERAPKFSTPVLVTLGNLLPVRRRAQATRIYWPKGMVTKGVSAPDARPPLPADAVEPAVAAIEAELLRRFAERPSFASALIDAALSDVTAPFNERTASRAAVALPRGSRLEIPAAKVVRLFLHWCQPPGGLTTDLDLSIGFYDAQWGYAGCCSYSELTLANAKGEVVAQSAGDLQDAPHPDGASEFIDLHREQALASGIRYAVMTVNCYAGLAFDQLERGFAGLMLRDDVEGTHFDPRTVELRFDLRGENGVFLPLVLDVQENTLHWLDVYAKGRFQFNTVQKASSAIQVVCPQLMEYFQSGTRASVYDLALLHAAARCRRVFLRHEGRVVRFERGDDEEPGAFLRRLRSDAGIPAALPDADGPPVFAALLRGDVDLPANSSCLAIFHERVAANLAPSDLL